MNLLNNTTFDDNFVNQLVYKNEFTNNDVSKPG